ncbi:MAG: hypothetical protein EOP86_24380, partial [Verrucomicrobiaceae bacterium]
MLCRSVELGLARTDTAEVEILDGSTGITDGAWVTLRCDGAPVLYGRAAVGRSADGRVTVDIRGPWEMLEAVTYQQTAQMAVPHAVDAEHPHGYALSGVLTPEAQLGMDDDGEARSTLQEARAIMDYAASAGVPVEFSASFAGMAMRPVQVHGASCAACLLTVMRFHPDVLLSFDYSGGDGAVLLARPAGDGPVAVYAETGAGRIVEARFGEKQDFRPAGVRIVYTRVRADGRIEGHTDTAGAVGGQGRGAYVINWPVRLEGPAPPPLLSQRIRTRPIPRSDDPEEPEHDETELKTNWWQTRLPWLRLPGVAEIVTISGHEVSVDPPDITPSEDETEDIPTTWSEDPADYPRELVDGAIPPWLPRAAAPLTVSAAFTLGDPSGLSGSVR